MINSLKHSLTLTFLLFFSGNLISQDAFLEMDRVYGLDPLLYNGKKYIYFLPDGTGGNPFLSSAEFIKGDVVIKGVRFPDILLNYDIYNQQLLLQYLDETGAPQIIEVSKAWLESFRLGDLEFKCVIDDKETRFFQALGDGPYQILYSWRKNFKLINSTGPSYYSFSLPIRTRYVMIDGELHNFKSKGSFIKIFDPSHQLEIRNYIQRNKINLKHASDQIMTDLINYTGNLN